MKLYFLLCFAFFAVAASEDPPCCRACCKVGSDYQCEKNANSCNGIGVKTDGQGKCGDGNNNVLCAAPKGGDEPSGGGGCACLVTVNGVSECKPAEECMAVFNKFMYIIENHLHWVIVGVVVMAVVCTGVCCFCGWCCCARKKLVLANRMHGDSFMEVVPVVLQQDNSAYSELK